MLRTPLLTTGPVEVKLRESQRTLATLMDNLPGMAYRCRNDADWTMEFVSEGALALTGYSPAQLIANTATSYGQLILPADREMVDREVQAALTEKRSFRIVYRIATASGAEKWVWEQGCGVLSKSGALQSLEGFITDITEAKLAQSALRKSEAQLLEAQAIAHLGSWDLNVATGEITGSEELLRIYGFEPRTALSSAMIFERIHPDDAAVVREAVDVSMNAGTDFSLDHRIVRSPGDIRHFHVEGRVVRDAGGKPLHLIGAGQDVTARHEADIVARALIEEQAARAAAEAAERRADFLAEASRLLGSSFDYQTTMATLMKLAVPRLADFATFDMVTPDGSVERIAVAHVVPEKEALLWELRRWLQVGGPIRQQLRGPLFDGKSLFVPDVTDAMLASTVIDEEHGALIQQILPRSLMTVALIAGGEIRGALALYASESARRFDAGDLALAEELARRASLAVENARLFQAAESATRARDQMLGIVAHDLRNPLGTIRMAAGLLEEVLDAASPARKQVAMVTRAVDRMNRLIGDLLDVKRLENGRLSVELRRCPAIAVLTEAVDMLKPVARDGGLELVLDAPATLPAVSVDPNRVQQVLSNLIGNAIKFTPKGGRITLRGEADREFVRVTVADTGNGIPPEQLPHIFSQFWQGSKTDKRGIGLGLSIAKGIVEAHGGRIWVQSTVGVGTSFHFTLLASEKLS